MKACAVSVNRPDLERARGIVMALVGGSAVILSGKTPA
jgi:hypothetical protein